MKLFDLYRLVDETGISGTGLIAQGVEFDDGTCALRWLTANRSTSLYDNETTMMAIHGHAGKTRLVHRGTVNSFDRGRVDAMQDRCENCPFACVGGLTQREAPVAPAYIVEGERAEYLRGYAQAAYEMYGEDWRTCSFGWAPAIAIGSPAALPSGQEKEGGQ